MSVRHSTIPPRNAFVCIHGTFRLVQNRSGYGRRLQRALEELQKAPYQHDRAARGTEVVDTTVG